MSRTVFNSHFYTDQVGKEVKGPVKVKCTTTDYWLGEKKDMERVAETFTGKLTRHFYFFLWLLSI